MARHMQFKRLDFQAAALTLLPSLALLLNFLNFNNYSFLKWESLIVIAALLVLALLALGLGALWRPAAYLIPAFWMVIYMDTLAPIMQKMQLRAGWQAVLYVAVALLLAMLLHRIGVKARNVAVVVFTVIVLSNAVLTQQSLPFERTDPQPAFQADASLPPYIHLILDAHIGVNGLPREAPGYAAAHETMMRFFERWGFRVFPAAFSHYSETEWSLPNLVGFTEISVNFDGQNVKRNRLFEELKARRYRLHVYESDSLHFCQPEGVHVDFCFTYNPNSLKGLNSIAMLPTVKALVVAGHWLGSMQLFQVAIAAFNYILRLVNEQPLELPDRSAPLNSIAALERIMLDVRTNPTGDAFFAHLIIPHEPYVYDAECTPSINPRQWTENPPTAKGLSDYARSELYGLYLSQLRCIYRFLDRWMTQLNQAGILDRSTIVLHGDHGAGISTYPLPHKDTEVVSLRMLRDNFSTLFAVHSPGLTPGLDPVVKPINRLARELIESPQQMSYAESDELFLLMHREIPTSYYDPKEILERYPISADLFAPPATP
jgi:hypothetical protein